MKIAITGGIGSGKTFVSNRLNDIFGIKVYDCDTAAKRLLTSSAEIKVALIQLVGNELYDDNVLQKQVLSQFILQSEQNKQTVNNIVHPAVAQDFKQSGYNWLESAILFESGFNLRTHIDKVICVTAPLETRVNRVMSRDNITRGKAMQWINSQMKQEEILARSDFEIIADGKENIDKQLHFIINNTH